MTRDSITDRIDAALEKMRWQQQEIRSIILNKADMKALDRANTIIFGVKGCKAHTCGYRGHVVKSGKHSRVYSTDDVQLAVPMLLSKRVAA